MKVHERVKAYIHENHLKQISIAKAANIPNSTFNAMINGKRTMYADDLEAVCKALGVSANKFVPATERQPTA